MHHFATDISTIEIMMPILMAISTAAMAEMILLNVNDNQYTSKLASI